jgi:hypothetical protein
MVHRILLYSLTLCNSWLIFYIIGRPDLHPSPGPHLRTVKVNKIYRTLLVFQILQVILLILIVVSISQIVLVERHVAYYIAGKIVNAVLRSFGPLDRSVA